MGLFESKTLAQLVRVFLGPAVLGISAAVLSFWLGPMNEAWTEGSVDSTSGSPNAAAGAPSLEKVVSLLEQTPTGAHLLAEAQKHWSETRTKGLFKHLAWGGVSRTDAVLTRSFDPETGTESRERSVTIVLSQQQSLGEVVLDLAHELTHAIAPVRWDPYDPHLTVTQYIKASIEGKGGEVEAVMNECQVALELIEGHGIQFKKGLSATRCEGYRLADGTLDAKLVRADFYRVGSWKKWLDKKISQADLPVSAERPRLFSSTGRKPYPVALYEEYQDMTLTACVNSRKRSQSVPVRRGPASVSTNESPSFGRLQKRCQALETAPSI